MVVVDTLCLFIGTLPRHIYNTVGSYARCVERSGEFFDCILVHNHNGNGRYRQIAQSGAVLLQEIR